MNCFSCCKLPQSKCKSFKKNSIQYSKKDYKLENTFSFFLRSLSHKSGTSRQKLISEEIQRVGNAKICAQVFSYKELVVATNNFSANSIVGEGGFGRVYKGHIGRTNQAVAIKQLDRNGMQGNREFFSELLMLSMVQNSNLVKLIGYCADDDQRILVYEFMPHGSLESHLLDKTPGKKPLDWDTRMKIAAGAARGLEFLHNANPPIIYRDFKASNILLDAEFNPRLSDFGLAKLGPTGGKEHVSTRVMGTYGYCAPEYQKTGQLTKMSDVYSFGVVFLEIISGRRVIDSKRQCEERNLIDWAEPFFKDKNKFTEMVDPLLEGKFSTKSLHQAIAIAALCLQEEAEARPTMEDVVTALEFLSKPKIEEKFDLESSRDKLLYADSLKESNYDADLEVH